ncbi:hypothetical protein ABIB51_002489 [Arthrobacter sp. UYCu712]
MHFVHGAVLISCTMSAVCAAVLFLLDAAMNNMELYSPHPEEVEPAPVPAAPVADPWVTE